MAALRPGPGWRKPEPVIIEDRRRGCDPLNGRLRRWWYPSQFLLPKVAAL